MKRSIAWGALPCFAALHVASAQSYTPTQEGGPSVPAWCDYTRSVAAAEAAVLLAPEVFGSVGVVNAGDAEGDAPLGSQTLRLTAGLGYNVVNAYRGVTLRRRAEAECRRYKALTALQSAFQAGPGMGTGPALAARLSVLEAAIPEGTRLLEALRTDLQEGRATVEEFNGLQLRLEQLRALAYETARAQERLALLPRPSSQPLPALLQELHAADDELERLAGTLRRTAAWDIRLRGGYDELIDVRQDLPLFGVLTVSYNLGGWAQSKANARARGTRQQASTEDVDGFPQRVERMLQELRTTRGLEETRLREVSVLVGDLEGQLREVQALETVKVRRFRDYLVLEVARLRAEQAWLQAHLESLQALLGNPSP
ncbi:hypothetical protein [Stigmatella aurantiaca]|uniref:Conserved uncharacterized protein n=1 Tax=Stigmatella aurantiaca (strain DW4/3-1) TaxID=378806 RepID=Q08TW5_STIAD|nr:hypothetical protein [Stigmatella aurantiaca]ADO71795.1 conserved uncharacterized protein [Stigmatella aurantiaca DW4/3-1]EAU63928.1 hypothetical protein STIAU_0266 [Stigmatella aurantiaca DW4/3-1]